MCLYSLSPQQEVFQLFLRQSVTDQSLCVCSGPSVNLHVIHTLWSRCLYTTLWELKLSSTSLRKVKPHNAQFFSHCEDILADLYVHFYSIHLNNHVWRRQQSWCNAELLGRQETLCEKYCLDGKTQCGANQSSKAVWNFSHKHGGDGGQHMFVFFTYI